jgi:hypothetical protein
MTQALIEIDVSQPWPGSEPRAGRPPVGATVLVIIGVLVALTGPALLRPDTLSQAWRAATTTGFFWAADGAAYTLDRAEGGVRLTVRDLRSGAPRWTVPLFGTLADVYARAGSFMSSNFPPDATTGVRTNVVDRQGGLPRLAFPSAALPMAYIGSRVALVFDRDPAVPPDPDADGRVRAMGLEWTYVATAHDLRTGRIRWRMRLDPGVRWSLPGVRAGAEGLAGLPPGRDWFVTSAPGGDVQVRDLDSANLVARRQFGPLRQQSYVVALVDSVLVRLDDTAPLVGSGDKAPLVGSADADRSTLDAYEPTTLARRWRYVPPATDVEPVDCEPLLCLADNRSVWVVDPRGGATLWRPTGPLLRPGPAGRLIVTGYGNLLILFDTRHQHRLRVDRGWRLVDVAAYSRHVVVVRALAAGSTADLGLLDVVTGAARRLGRVTRWEPTTRCLHAGGHILCGDGAQVRVWRA